ncbi:hypothetical protein BJQ90_01326 [Arthrobacter sp. SO3]|nr:hypothetical protein [Arthrobacter sp. SO3]
MALAGTVAHISAHMRCMETRPLPEFGITHRRNFAQQVSTGRTTNHSLESYRDTLFAEVALLTYLVAPETLEQAIHR